MFCPGNRKARPVLGFPRDYLEEGHFQPAFGQPHSGAFFRWQLNRFPNWISLPFSLGPGLKVSPFSFGSFGPHDFIFFKGGWVPQLGAFPFTTGQKGEFPGVKRKFSEKEFLLGTQARRETGKFRWGNISRSCNWVLDQGLGIGPREFHQFGPLALWGCGHSFQREVFRTETGAVLKGPL